MQHYELSWRDVRGFRLTRRAATRPVRIAVALEDGSTLEPDALAQTLIKGPRQERRLREMVDEMNSRAAELRGIR
jgi:hypothetical protein